MFFYNVKKNQNERKSNGVFKRQYEYGYDYNTDVLITKNFQKKFIECNQFEHESQTQWCIHDWGRGYYTWPVRPTEIWNDFC